MRIALQGTGIAVRIAGAGAVKTAKLLQEVFREEKKTKGRVRISNMLRRGHELRVFEIKDSELRKFAREAKRYGVLYTVIKDRSNGGDITEILVRADEAERLNRIMRNMDISAQKPEKIVRQPTKGLEEAEPQTDRKVLTPEEKTEEFLREIIKGDNRNPTEDRIARSNLSGPFSEKRSDITRAADSGRSSVRAELRSIIQSLKEQNGSEQIAVPQYQQDRGR